jgi:hypothetical protein
MVRHDAALAFRKLTRGSPEVSLPIGSHYV